jgi:putative ABC transport system permease protein
MMKLEDFRVGLRVLLADPAYSLVTILGLGVGLAVCLLLLSFARYSWQYDAHVPDADQVYVVKRRQNLELGAPWSDQAPVLLREVANATPGVTAASGYLTWFPVTVKAKGGQPRSINALTVLPGFGEMMGLRTMEGDLEEALSRPDSFAIAESAAIRAFGTADVLGRAVTLSTVDDGQRGKPSACTVRIAAILRNSPSNTTIPFEALHGPDHCLVPTWMGEEALVGEHGFPGNLLVRVRPDASLGDITAALQRAVDDAPAVRRMLAEWKESLGGRKPFDIKLSPLREAYFDGAVEETFLSRRVDRGDRLVVAGLVAVALLILLLAAINYVNLATIRVMRRQREVAMRKVLGAGRWQLAGQFVAESLLVTVLTIVIGLALAWLALPAFGELMDRDLGTTLSLGTVAAALGLGVALGLVTAIHPVSIAFGVRPARMLAGRAGTESTASRHLRQILSVLQVAVAMGMASYAMAVSWQSRFAMEASPGFDPSPLLVFQLPDAITGTMTENSRNFLAALAQRPGVAGIAVSAGAVGRAKDRPSAEIRREGGRSVQMDVKYVTAGFFERYGIRPLAGRLFDPKVDREENPVPIVINALAAHELGFASPELAIGQLVHFKGGFDGRTAAPSKRIVGIAPEIRLYSLREAPRAVAYDLWMTGGTVTVRASGSIAEAERVVRELWARYFPNAELQMSPAKSIYAADYAEDARLAKLLSVGTVIAMLIAAFGAYVLVADTVQRRSGEIALRKLFGARRRDIGRLMARELGVIVLGAAIIALPLAALAIARYLASYTEQAPVTAWAPLIALAAALAVVAVAAIRHAWIAMVLKPAVVLRNQGS